MLVESKLNKEIHPSRQQEFKLLNEACKKRDKSGKLTSRRI